MKKSILILGISLALISLSVFIMSNNKTKSILEQNIEVLAQNEGTSNNESKYSPLSRYKQVTVDVYTGGSVTSSGSSSDTNSSTSTSTSTTDTTSSTTSVSSTNTCSVNRTFKTLYCCQDAGKKKTCPYGDPDCWKYGYMNYSGS